MLITVIAVIVNNKIILIIAKYKENNTQLNLC